MVRPSPNSPLPYYCSIVRFQQSATLLLLTTGTPLRCCLSILTWITLSTSGMPIYAQLHDSMACPRPPTNPPVHTYRHRGRWPPPEPKPVLHRHPPLPTYPYIQLPQTNPATTRHHDIHQRAQDRTEGRSESRDSSHRRVRFADHPVVIELPNYPSVSGDTSSGSAPSRTVSRSRPPSRYPGASAAHPPPSVPAPSAIRPPSSTPPPNARQTTQAGTCTLGRQPSAPAPASAPSHSRHDHSYATTPLHDLLTSFPSGLWDMRRNARPTYDRHYDPHYPDLAFPHNPTKSSIKLYFIPCGRMEFSWIAKIKAKCRTHLTVNDVLEGISTELFRRSACRDLYDGHPCYRKVRSAHRVRTRSGYSRKPHYDDAIRNVDLYHVDRGQALYFKGLCREKLRDGDVAYVVKFSYA